MAQLGCLPHIDKPRVYNCRDFAYKDTLELVQKPDEQRTEQQKQSDGVAVNYIYNNNYCRYCIAQCKWCEQQNWALALLIKYYTNHHRRLAHNKKSRHITKKHQKVTHTIANKAKPTKPPTSRLVGFAILSKFATHLQEHKRRR